MGVHGLWRLIEPSGKPVPLETLENKVLAVDISIWLHQAVKGFQDARGASLPNAHLLGIYHRVCKLLFFRIKPVFVFDGGVPALKKQTIGRRNQHSAKIKSDATSIQQKILTSLLKHSAIQQVLSEEGENSGENLNKNILVQKKPKDDLFKLPAPVSSDLDTTQESSEFTDSDSSPTKWDLHTIDERSAEFMKLPPEVRHDILTDCIAQRKQSSWGRLHQLPKKSGDFSSFQMNRLLKRFSVQQALEETNKEMGGHALSLNELEALLTEEGIVTAADKSNKRIAADEHSSYLLIKDFKKALETAKNNEKQKLEEQKDTSLNQETVTNLTDDNPNLKIKDPEYERDLQEAIKLSLMETPSTSKEESSLAVPKVDIADENNFDYLLGFNDGDFESSSDSEEDFYILPKKSRSAAESYMLEYADLTPFEVDNLFKKDNRPEKKKSKKGKIMITDPDQEIYKNEELKTIDNLDEKCNEHQNCDKIDLKMETNIVDVQNTNLFESSSEKLGYQNVLNENAKQIDENKTRHEGNLSEKIEIGSEISELGPVEDKKGFVECPGTPNEAVSNHGDQKQEPISDSDDSEFVEVNPDVKPKTNDDMVKKTEISEDSEKITKTETKAETIDLMSDSDDSDFIEVESKISPPKAPSLQLVIDTTKKIEDDLFKDIFDNETPKKLEELIKNTAGHPSAKIRIDTSTKEPQKEVNATKVADKSSTNEIVEKSEVMSKRVSFDPALKEKDISNKGKQKEVKKKLKISVEDLNKMKETLKKEQHDLLIEKNTKDRMGSDITNQMYQEAQELLELFGVPYVVAPMEAEAQCAFLNQIGLTDGTITDDSDIWLFGGNIVYKNFFNQKKHVLEYRAENIQHYFRLSREQMILLALLVGSDYTLGIQGIGPVTALEVLAAFPPLKKHALSTAELLSGLREFKHWFYDGGKLGLGRTTLRSKLQNIEITDGFPSLQVVQAYLQPEVETSEDAFTWSKPDVVGLMDYAREKFGWTRLKSEEILNPVIKKLEDTAKQKTLRDYFATKHKIEVDLTEGKVSKRVKMAIEKMGKSREELQQEEEQKTKRIKGKKESKNQKETKTNRKPREKPKKLTLSDDSEPISVIVQEADDLFANLEEQIDLHEKSLKTKDTISVKKPQTKKDTIESKPKPVRTRKVSTSERPKIQRRDKTELHTKEVIPQREKDKANALKTKLRAIEIFRKSKIEGKHEKKARKVREPKEDAELSESSDSS